jgi:transcriptional regulator with XRE-family HTH domain
MTIKEKFKLIRKDLQLNQVSFGANLGTNQVSIADIENGRKNPNMDILVILHKKFQVNLNWFIAGTGNMKYEYQIVDQPADQPEKHDDKWKTMIDMQKETIEAQKAAIEALRNNVESQKATIEAQKSTIETYKERMEDLEKKAEKWR